MDANTINAVAEPLLGRQLAFPVVAQSGCVNLAETVRLSEIVDHDEPRLCRIHLAKRGVWTLGRRYLFDRDNPPTRVADFEGLRWLGRCGAFTCNLCLLP